MSSALAADAVRSLEAYQPGDPEQERLRAAYLDHLVEHPDGIWRDGPPVHLTASAFVVDPARERTVLVWHRKGGFWVQPGGHLEPGDATLAGAALREAREETGLTGLSFAESGPDSGPVDLHRHALSSAFGRCAEHLDVAYLLVAPAEARPVVSEESLDVRWWPLAGLPDDVVPDLPARLARLSR